MAHVWRPPEELTTLADGWSTGTAVSRPSEGRVNNGWAAAPAEGSLAAADMNYGCRLG